MKTYDLYCTVLSKNPSAIDRIAAEEVIPDRMQSATTLNESHWVFFKDDQEELIGMAYPFEPTKDLNHIRELENKIKDVHIFVLPELRYVLNLLRLVGYNGDCKIECSEIWGIQKLPASDKLYCFLDAVLGEEKLRERLEGI